MMSGRSGYLYLLNEGPSSKNTAPEYNILFPTVAVNQASAHLNANEPLLIPPQWFRFDFEQGNERLWMIWSAGQVPELEAVRGFANAVDRGAVQDARRALAVRDFLARHATERPKAVSDRSARRISLRGGRLWVHRIDLHQRKD